LFQIIEEKKLQQLQMYTTWEIEMIVCGVATKSELQQAFPLNHLIY
jgi:hypothetical protein